MSDGDMLAQRAPSPCLIVTTFWVFFGRVTAVVDSGGTVVLVSQDGIQRPPFHFPKGGHLLQFLSCLENGLLPHGQLDPPLWSQRGKVSKCGGPGKLGLGSALGSSHSCPLALVWLHRLCTPHQGPRAMRVGRQVCHRDRVLGHVLSGQSISQTAQAKPSGFC